MSGFTSQALEKRLGELNNSAQTIQTFSLWLIHHRKHHKIIVQTWFKELKKASQNRKLTFMYLANDVIQNSRKKGPEFTKEFASALKPAFSNVANDADEKTWKGLDRILSVWSERSIYEPEQISEFRKAINDKRNLTSTNSNNANKKDDKIIKFKSRLSDKDDNSPTETKRLKTAHKQIQKNSQGKINSKKNDRMDIDVNTVIDADALLNALQAMENSASSDACIREKIASLPSEVSDVTLLEKICDKDAAEKLAKQVDEACAILSDYNSRLSQELEERKKISLMLAHYLKIQKNSLMLADQKLSDYKKKLRKITQVRNELKSHLQNLPDLSLLPSVTGGLAPLPSAGDLFSISAKTVQKVSFGSTSSASSATPSPADYETLSMGTPSSGQEDNYPAKGQ